MNAENIQQADTGLQMKQALNIHLLATTGTSRLCIGYDLDNSHILSFLFAESISPNVLEFLHCGEVWRTDWRRGRVDVGDPIRDISLSKGDNVGWVQCSTLGLGWCMHPKATC